ncbi:4-hydroxy-tetrahydrodipicolinate reductase [Halococcoides cellulosivorans]|uniref:4-hydroxy-tetrahydrodipicolinate reductase n=1 Tax=Halococcoides cellulosivorans TaxID=1679096 RepID=A0A2R4X0Q1_9EURY|nr:4-hydroxy-tetrahydrodipicolinate reductase [Halococcoides cellulosivorans]AWB27369.1 4-hydroxy-tetrahydrodipicolinate reductase [Halococcoides cellulosivorans]
MTTVAVLGADGRTGGAVVEAITDRHDADLAAAVDAEPRPDAQPPIEASDDLATLLADRGVDVLVDFSIPEAIAKAAPVCAEAGVAIVTGTTGLEAHHRATLDAASESVPVLKAANFARGIQVLLQTVETAVRGLPGYDIELTETHHNGKRDAPSGTAETILETIDSERAHETVYGREGIQPREEDEVGVHVRRAGTIRGEHEVMLADNDEVVSLAHRAEDRGVFAAGALDAAAWIDGRDPGWYDFADVVDVEGDR